MNKNAGRKNLFILAFTLIVVMLGFEMVIPIFPFYIDRLGAGGKALGLLVATAALTEFLFGPIWGSISDRTGRKPILMVGVFGYGLSLLLFGLSTRLWMLFASRALSGILSSATLSTSMAYIGDSTSEKERAGGMGLLGAAAGVGIIIGPGLGGLLAGGSLATILREFTDIMEDEIAKLDNFISKFLGSSLSDMELAEADINRILKKAEVITSFQANTHKVTMKYEYGKVPAVKIDPFQFEQAILNVINNALEAMPDGGELTVRSATTRRHSKKWIMLEIGDTGGGIYKPKKGVSSTEALQEGRGYGLFIARELLQSFKGDMEISNRRNSGTTVKMYLPAM